jgi:hypothetical protein
LVGGADFVVIVVRQLHLDGHYARCGTSLKASILQALPDKRIGFAKYLLKCGSGVLHGHAAI